MAMTDAGAFILNGFKARKEFFFFSILPF